MNNSYFYKRNKMRGIPLYDIDLRKIDNQLNWYYVRCGICEKTFYMSICLTPGKNYCDICKTLDIHLMKVEAKITAYIKHAEYVGKYFPVERCNTKLKKSFSFEK